MVFGGQINFSTPPKFRPPNFVFGPQTFFFGGFFFFSAPKRKNLGSFFFFRRRLVMVFGGQITFSTPQKYFSAFFFLDPMENADRKRKTAFFDLDFSIRKKYIDFLKIR